MNELPVPVIGFPRLRKELWDCQVANIATYQKKIFSKKLFRATRKRFLREINKFSPSFYREWILAMLIRNNVEYVFV